MSEKEITIVTHNGGFHTDDVFAVATILLSLEKQNGAGANAKILRTRNPEDFATGDYVVDVGGVYDPATNRFDHHQKGGAGKRETGIPFASFGLVWKHLGPIVCGGDDEVAEKIDTSVVAAIDANDNGLDISKNLFDGVYSPSLSLNFMIDKPTWEERSGDTEMDARFEQVVMKAKVFLERYIIVSAAAVKAKREIRATYTASQNKSIIVFAHDYERVNFMQTLALLPEIIFFVYPNHSGAWTAETVPVSENTFEKRKSFPESWGGLSGAALAEVTGVEDADFCHNGRFFVRASSEAGAIKLAKIALES